VIQILGKEKLWGDALKAYTEMKVNNLRPNVITFNSLITACGRSGRWKEALEV
jgi:pentatricopeptide repeat protein